MKAQQRQIIEHYIQSYNAFDTDGMARDLHEDIVFENVSNGEVNLKTEGITAFKEQAETARQYFETRQQMIEAWDFQDNHVIIDIAYRGVLAIDLPNGMKPGDTLQLQGQSEFIFKDGRIIKIRDKS